MSPDEPVLRYRIELHTDKNLLWFARIETCPEGDRVIGYTKTAETWQEALVLAQERIKEQRKG